MECLEMKIDVSFWTENTMPVAIQALVGYETCTNPVPGGTKSYHWLRFLGWGIEICVARKADHLGSNERERKDWGETDPRTADAKHDS